MKFSDIGLEQNSLSNHSSLKVMANNAKINKNKLCSNEVTVTSLAIEPEGWIKKEVTYYFDNKPLEKKVLYPSKPNG